MHRDNLAGDLEKYISKAIPDGILVVDRLGVIQWVNPAAAKITGYDEFSLLGRSLEILLPHDIREKHVHLVQKFFSAPVAREMGSNLKIKVRRADETCIPVDIALGICDMSGQKFAVAVMRDRREYERIQDQLYVQATQDSLTGLPNRWQFMQLLNLAISQQARKPSGMALLLLDVDNFKVINDMHGHAAGDHVLVEISSRFRNILRSGEVFARIGGDEFAIFITGRNKPSQPGQLAERLIAAAVQPYRINECEVTTSLSIGISTFPDDAQDIETLMSYADIAMYQAKESGRNRYFNFMPAMRDSLVMRSRISERLKAAVTSGVGLKLIYQPQIDVSTGKICGAEALLRWNDIELGEISPADFIPIAEIAGLMPQLGRWVLEAAFRQQLAWRQAGVKLCMSINLSPRQLDANDLAATILELLQQYKLPAECIELEITESAAMHDIALARTLMEKLRETGVLLTLDDFGKGQSSLAYLQELPIDKIKIDASFVQKMHSTTDGSVLVHVILMLARALKKEVVAEGVETQEQFDFLRRHGCHYIQGWLFSKAVPACELTAELY